MRFRQRRTPAGRARRMRAAVLLAVSGGVLVPVTTASPAGAAGTSATRYGCYTQWWNTTWAQKCPSGAQVVGLYGSSVGCRAQGTRYLDRYRLTGDWSTATGDDCAFGVTGGDLTYLGY